MTMFSGRFWNEIGGPGVTLIVGLGLTAVGILQWSRGQSSMWGPIGIAIAVFTLFGFIRGQFRSLSQKRRRRH